MWGMRILFSRRQTACLVSKAMVSKERSRDFLSGSRDDPTVLEFIRTFADISVKNS